MPDALPVDRDRRPTFFMKRSDRLIARLRHLMYGLRFARQVDGQMIMAWTPQPKWSQQFDGPDYHVNHVFDLRAWYAEGGYRELIFFDSITPFPEGLPSLQGVEFDAVRPRGFDRSWFLDQAPTVYSGNYYGYQFADEGKSLADLDREVRGLWARLPHDPLAARILAQAKERIGGTGYIALHVRRGDVGAMLKRDLPLLADGTVTPEALRLTLGHYLSRTAPYDFYYPEIERSLAAGARILFTSDSPETLQHFTDKYGVKPFIDINRFVRSRFPIQKAFLDFNMLIGAERIISTGSTYAAFAATLGRGQLANVAMSGPIDRLDSFLFEEYVPQLGAHAGVRRAVRGELEQLYRGRRRQSGAVPPDSAAAEAA